MYGSNSNKNDVKSILTPVVSFALLGILVVGAVIFGNLVVERTDGCRPLGSPAEDNNATLLVVSDEDDALMLCDVPQETVEYVPPERSESEIQIRESLYRIASYSDSNDAGELSGVIEGNDILPDGSGYLILPSDPRAPVYVKGEFGSLEDCMFFGESSFYKSDDFDGFDGSDMFHPDRIQSCWIEIEDYHYDVNSG